jgi:hypothetical protein
MTTQIRKTAMAKTFHVPFSDILRVLLNEQYFSDGLPTWSEGRKQRGAETSDEAKRRSLLLIKALLRDEREAALPLAEKLERCSPSKPCQSGACPSCTRAAQRLLVDATGSAFAAHDEKMLAVSIAFGSAAIPESDLTKTALFTGIRRRVSQVFESAGVAAIGGFDVSLNEHADGDFAPHWLPHLWAIVPTAPMRQFERDFRQQFPRDRLVRRPVKILQFDGAPAGFAYALKSVFVRRITLPARELEDGVRSTFGTRSKVLYGSARVELALALDRAGLGERLFIRGHKLVADNGRVTCIAE